MDLKNQVTVFLTFIWIQSLYTHITLLIATVWTKFINKALRKTSCKKLMFSLDPKMTSFAMTFASTSLKMEINIYNLFLLYFSEHILKLTPLTYLWTLEYDVIESLSPPDKDEGGVDWFLASSEWWWWFACTGCMLELELQLNRNDTCKHVYTAILTFIKFTKTNIILTTQEL